MPTTDEIINKTAPPHLVDHNLVGQDGFRLREVGRQFGLIDRVQPLRQRQAGTAIHAHIQRRIETKGKTALGFIQLRRGHPQIEQDAIHCRDAKTGQHLPQLCKARMQQR